MARRRLRHMLRRRLLSQRRARQLIIARSLSPEANRRAAVDLAQALAQTASA